MTLPICEHGHPLIATVVEGDLVSCLLCGESGTVDSATVHPSGEFCRKTGCHPEAEAR